jgi:acyl-CoA synthetase (AMP-forming)/AMP-acid ligase II
MVIHITEHPDRTKYDLSSLRILVYVGSAMPAEAAKRAWKVFGPILYQIYGATEGGGTILKAEDHARALSDPSKEYILKSAGRPILGSRVKILDDSDREVPTGIMGEICFHQSTTVEQYWNQPEETAQTFKNGWYHTGDMGKIDDEGYVFILDRKKDIIVSGGENISSRDVENVVLTHPAVLECAAIGVPSENWVEEVKTIVVPRPGMSVTAEEIMEYCKDKLAGYKRPRSVEVWKELPRNPSGKVLKREMRKKYWPAR